MAWREREGYDEGEDWWNEPDDPYEPPPDDPGNGRIWTDPDNAPNPRMYDPSAPPDGDPGPGNYWAWDGGMWIIRATPRFNPPQPPPSGPPPSNDPYGGGGGGGGSYPTYPGFSGRPPAQVNYPGFTAPQFQAPAPFSFDPFSYEDFKAPTLEEAQAEPGFEYAMRQGLKAMENSKAYLGTYRTGGTIKGLNDYARNMANQNYTQVFNRSADIYDRNRGNAFGTWSANRENAADAYATNYGISRDVFDRHYQGARDEHSAAARGAELQAARDWDIFQWEGDDDYRRWKAMIDANRY